MKRAGKLTIEIEHREITLALVVKGSSTGAPAHVEQGIATPERAPCQTCGGAGSVALAAALAGYQGSPDALSHALAAGDLHLSPSEGAMWLCEKSFGIFLATLPPVYKETPR